jgi:MOSC domain-containing protein YiiM
VNDAGRIVQISVSPGGVPKRPVDAAEVTSQGVAGDAQRDREHHGGLDRAVCLFSMEGIRDLQAEGHPIEPGHIGENLTLEGIDWEAVKPGTRLLLGEDVLLEITRYTSPCHNIRDSFVGGNFGRVSQKKHPGSSRVYARVLRTGAIRRGDSVRLVTPHPNSLLGGEGEVRG